MMMMIVAGGGAWIGGMLGQQSKGRRAVTVMLFPCAILAPVFVGGVLSLFAFIGERGLAVITTGFSNPGGLLAWFLESGIELSGIGFFTTLAAYFYMVKRSVPPEPATTATFSKLK